MNKFAIYYDPSAYSLKGKVMGRQSAGLSFIRAIADSRPGKVWCYASTPSEAKGCAQTLADLGSPRTGVIWVPADQPHRLSDPGILFRPDPGIGQHAWHRLSQSTSRAYSLCGITHTISSHGPMSAFAEYLSTPIESWDAVICTSRAAREAIRSVIEQQAEFLTERFAAKRFTLPQLPVIPLGTHTKDFEFTEDERLESRARLGISSEEVVVLFAGRLIIHGKAHPLPMYIALEAASKGKKVVLIQAGQAPNQEILKIFEEDPKRFCPSVRTIIIDGKDFGAYRSAWASADVFTSLSDNIQETYGLTPIEAMAAGIPVVVSDWNGYKDTIIHNEVGFRVPTISLSPNSGVNLAHRYDIGLSNFDYYSGYASQLVAVDINAAEQAYSILIDNAELRRKMGQAGAQRARAYFDWKVIIQKYYELWAELEERRRSDSQLYPPLSRRQRPDRADPFTMFAHYPTFRISSATKFRLRVENAAPEAIKRRNLASISFAGLVIPDEATINKIIMSLDFGWKSYDDIAKLSSLDSPKSLAASLVWLSKIGILDFQHS